MTIVYNLGGKWVNLSAGNLRNDLPGEAAGGHFNLIQSIAIQSLDNGGCVANCREDLFRTKDSSTLSLTPHSENRINSLGLAILTVLSELLPVDKLVNILKQITLAFCAFLLIMNG